MKRLSPVKMKLLDLLSDGRPHLADDMVETCLGEGSEGPKRSTLYVHIHQLNQELREIGEEIVHQMLSRRLHYRHIRHLRSPNKD